MNKEIETITLNGKKYVSKKKYDKLEKDFKEITPEFKENRFIVTDPSNVMGIVKVEEEDDKLIVFLGKETWEFPKSNRCDLWQHLDSKEQYGESIVCKVDGEKWCRISSDLYEQAGKTSEAFGGGKDLTVYAKDKNSPVLITTTSNLGFVIAPRVDSEDLE